MKHAAFLLGAILLFLTTSFAQDNSADVAIVRAIQFGPGVFQVHFCSRRAAAAYIRCYAGRAPSHSRPQPLVRIRRASRQPNERMFTAFSRPINGKRTAVIHFFVSLRSPSRKENMNGLDVGLVYYPTSSWFGVDGDILGAIRNIL